MNKTRYTYRVLAVHMPFGKAPGAEPLPGGGRVAAVLSHWNTLEPGTIGVRVLEEYTTEPSGDLELAFDNVPAAMDPSGSISRTGMPARTEAEPCPE